MSDQSLRATGRTTRMLVLALSHMLRGERIVVVGHTQSFAEDMRSRAMLWLETNGWAGQSRVPLTSTRDSIRFGSGEVRFVGYKSTALSNINLGLRKHEMFTEIWDHHALEERAKDQARLERIAAQEQIKLLMQKHGWSRASLSTKGDLTFAVRIAGL